MEISKNVANFKGIASSGLEFSYEFHGEKFYRFTILTERLSGEVDEIPVIVSNKIIDGDTDIEDCEVELVGQIRTRNQDGHLIVYIFCESLDFSVTYAYFKDVNEVEFYGYLCKAPIYRKTPKGREICDLLIAINRTYNKSSYIPCVCWGRNAKYASRLEVGCELNVLGRFQSREYKKKYEDGTIETKTAYEVSLSMIDKAKENEMEGGSDRDN